jgi:hypothetical protein
MAKVQILGQPCESHLKIPDELGSAVVANVGRRLEIIIYGLLHTRLVVVIQEIWVCLEPGCSQRV